MNEGGMVNASIHERYFFEIPVFRCGKNQWLKEQEDKKIKLASLLSRGLEITPREMNFAENYLERDWSAYRYSELVGMIRLFAINMQIRAELYFIQEKVSKSLKRKKWRLADPKVFEYWIMYNYTNEEIFSWILKRIEEENKKWLLKNRYIDLEAFKCSGKYIDYLKLVNFREYINP